MYFRSYGGIFFLHKYVDSMSAYICNRDPTVLLVSMHFVVYEFIVIKNYIALLKFFVL